MTSDDEFVRLFQQRTGLKVDGFAGADTIAMLDQLAPAKALSAVMSEIPIDYFSMLAKIESANRLYVKAPTSSGSGLYQFLKASWIGEGGSWGGLVNAAFGGLQPSAEEQTARARTFTAKNAAYLKSKGIAINKASLYAAHFFGPMIAAQVIQANVKDRADTIAGDAATKANPSILKNKTVGEFLSWLHGKTGEWAR